MSFIPKDRELSNLLAGTAGVTANGYDPRLYRLQKATGERLPNGLPPLKRLTGRHIRILTLHLVGIKGIDIARACGVRGITVSRIINDPLGRAFLRRHYEDVENEFQALLGPAIDTLRDALSSDTPIKERLRGADTFFRRRGDYKETVEKKDTAEDVVQKVLANIQVNVQVNNGGSND